MKNNQHDNTEAAESQSTPVTYKDAGVNIDAGNALVEAIKPLVRATKRAGADTALGGFGGVFDLKSTGFKDPLLVAATDGVGTKLRVAGAIGKHDTIGIDLVAMCVNDLLVQGAEPLFFLDYFATGALDVETTRAVIAGISDGCSQAGCALIGGETAEMPGMYAGGDYDLAGFTVGAVDRQFLLPVTDSIVDGDVLIGLPSSGLHSNGYSLVRKLVERAALDWNAPAPWRPGLTVAEALLIPTKIYVEPVLKLLSDTRSPESCGPIKAMAHITGGGLSENIPRVLPDNLGADIDLATWDMPSVFTWCATNGRLDDTELLRTFNCGIGLVLCVASDQSDDILKRLEDLGESPIQIGEIVRTQSPTPDGVDQDSPSTTAPEPKVRYIGQIQHRS
ncbi:MAG: phosphoribosylformylglycinamidine cyclo-ligase [Pseudomonadota bacterium]